MAPRITLDQIARIRKPLAQGKSPRTVAALVRVSRSTVDDVNNGVLFPAEGGGTAGMGRQARAAIDRAKQAATTDCDPVLELEAEEAELYEQVRAGHVEAERETHGPRSPVGYGIAAFRSFRC